MNFQNWNLLNLSVPIQVAKSNAVYIFILSDMSIWVYEYNWSESAHIFSRLANRLFQNNWIFWFRSQNHCLNFFNSFFSKAFKFYCICDCWRKRRHSAKSDSPVLTKKMTCFRNLEQLSRIPTKIDQYLLKEQR